MEVCMTTEIHSVCVYMFMCMVHKELDRIQEVDPAGKAIVFSQFVNMLDLVEYRIQIGGYRCVKLVGSMSVDHRDRALTAFKEDPDVKVSGYYCLLIYLYIYLFVLQLGFHRCC